MDLAYNPLSSGVPMYSLHHLNHRIVGYLMKEKVLTDRQSDRQTEFSLVVEKNDKYEWCQPLMRWLHSRVFPVAQEHLKQRSHAHCALHMRYILYFNDNTLTKTISKLHFHFSPKLHYMGIAQNLVENLLASILGVLQAVEGLAF